MQLNYETAVDQLRQHILRPLRVPSRVENFIYLIEQHVPGEAPVYETPSKKGSLAVLKNVKDVQQKRLFALRHRLRR